MNAAFVGWYIGIPTCLYYITIFIILLLYKYLESIKGVNIPLKQLSNIISGLFLP